MDFYSKLNFEFSDSPREIKGSGNREKTNDTHRKLRKKVHHFFFLMKEDQHNL